MEKLAFESVDRVRKIHFHQCGWTSYNQLRASIEQKGIGKANSLSLLGLGHFLLLPLDIRALVPRPSNLGSFSSGLPNSQAFVLN